MSRIYNNKPLPPGWMMYVTDTGLPYFHHSLTAQTQWEPPVSNDLGSSATATSGAIDLSAAGGETALPSTNLNLSTFSSEARRNDGDVATSATPLGAAADVAAKPLSSGHHKKVAYTPLHEDADNLAGSIAGGDIAMSGRDAFTKSRLGDSSSSSTAAGTTGASAWQPLSWGIQSVRPFFDVSTDVVLKRIKTSLFPVALLKGAAALAAGDSSSSNMRLSDDIRDTPDFYGPFWISTTLVFCLFALSNSAAYLAGALRESNFQAFVLSFFMIYGFLFTIPGIICLLTLAFGTAQDREAWGPRQVFTVYGYSFSLAFPMALLCLVPSMIFRWLVCSLGSAISLLFIVLHFRRDLVGTDPFLKLCLLGVFVVAQVVLYSMMPLYYFNV